MRKNTALARWRAGEQTVGGWLSTPSSYNAEVMASAGFDWLCVDMQHGLLDYPDVVHMLQAISTSDTTPIVRVAGNDPTMIMKVLDAGAMGVIVPMVNNRAEAERAISACRYPPKGLRSFGPIRAALYGGKGYAQEANDEIACIAMIETKEGLDNLESIITTEGLGGIYIGPSDLALAIDLPPRGDTDDAKHLATVDRIVQCCKKHNVPVGIHTGGIAYTKIRLAAGFNFVTLNSDSGFMATAMYAELAQAKGAVKDRENTGY